MRKPLPQGPRWNLNGLVRSSAGSVIVGAVVAVVDGQDAGKEALSDTSGRYGFTGLRQGGFTIRATASGFLAVTQTITLTANTNADFQLPRPPVAAFTAEGSLIVSRRDDGTLDLSGIAVNSGDGCASTLTGATTVTSATGSALAFFWTLSPPQTIRPGDRVTYVIGSMTPTQAAAFGAGGSYVTTFAFTSTGC